MIAVTDSWFSVVDADEPLLQGDLIGTCPLLAWASEVEFGKGGTEELEGAANAVQVDVVVMTQACDLEQEKVSNVILCPHFGLTEYKATWEKDMTSKGQTPSPRAWGSLCDQITEGFIWNLSMINALEGGLLSSEHRIVDFHEVYSAPREFLESFLQSQGEPRLRLLPPYREHLSQAFARFFMRVGLPTPIAKPWRSKSS